MAFLGDVTMATMGRALDDLALRSDVRANNMANTNTPGFKASHVDFESSLADALESGDIDNVGAPVQTPRASLPHKTANTVSMETEMIEE